MFYTVLMRFALNGQLVLLLNISECIAYGGAFAYRKGYKMDIKFERNGIVKSTHEKFTADLIAVGWSVVTDKTKDVKRTTKKGK